MVLVSVRIVLAFTVAVVLVLPAVPAAADAVDSAVASTRGSALPNRAELEQVANASASRQAANLQIAHTSLSSLTSICSNAGEIVGAASSIQRVFELFMESGYHRDLLLSSTWTAMGTGAVTGTDGKIYVSVVFCRELGPSSAPTPAPTPTPAPAPAAPPPPPTSTATQTASVAAPVSPALAAPASPTYPAFDEVLARLLDGDLVDLWLQSFDPSATSPTLGPSSFLPLAAWTTPTAPALI